MSNKIGYGQYCPIAITAEVLCERWTPLVIRSLCMGATRYTEIHQSVPRMSSALLSRRLRELEEASILERREDTKGRGTGYYLTEAGKELFPVLESMGFWSQKWLRREITHSRNLDPDILMWELRRSAIDAGRRLEQRRVAEFRLQGVPPSQQRYWLVFEPDDVDICGQDPGFDVDIWISARIKDLIAVWMGHRSIASALKDESLRLDGDKAEIRAFSDWFCLSHFARAG